MTALTELPAGPYTVDTDHSHIGFVAKLGLGLKAKGHFDRFQSVINIGPSPAESSMTLTVWTDSVQTGIKMRDKHLRAGNVLAVGEFPTMEFRSTTILLSGSDSGYDVEGILRVRDISQPVAFHATPVEQPGPGRYQAEMFLTPGEFGITRAGTTKPLKVLLDITLTPRQPHA